MTIESLIIALTEAVTRQTEATEKNNTLIELALSKSPEPVKPAAAVKEKKGKPAPEPEPEVPATIAAEPTTPVVDATEDSTDPDALAEESDIAPIRELVRQLQAKVDKASFNEQFSNIRDSFGVKKLAELRKSQIADFVAKLEGVVA